VRSRGFAVSLAIIFTYYILLSMGQGFAEQGDLPPVIGLWLPNVVLGAVGVALFRRAAREQSIAAAGWFDRIAAVVRPGSTAESRLGARA
jgi:lipopolysaccharide export system permease protein